MLGTESNPATPVKQVDLEMAIDIVQSSSQKVLAAGIEHSNEHDKHEHVHEHGINEHAIHEHVHGMNLIKDESATKIIIKAFIMEGSIAVHSIIIGIDLGALGSEDTSTIKALMIAFAFHQFFEGVSLGTTIATTDLSHWVCLAFGILFSFTLPFGVIIGMSTAQSDNGDVVKAVANCLACGSLIYTALIEMIAEDFADPYLNDKPLLKLKMFIAVFLGCVFMSLLAEWA